MSSKRGLVSRRVFCWQSDRRYDRRLPTDVYGPDAERSGSGSDAGGVNVTTRHTVFETYSFMRRLKCNRSETR